MYPVKYETSARAGVQLSQGYWELSAGIGSNKDLSDHTWPDFGVTETIVVSYDRTSEVTLSAGIDSVMSPVLQDHNAVLIHLSAGSSTPWNTLTVRDIRINGIRLEGFIPMVVEVAVKHHEYLLVTELPKVGVNIDSYTMELDVVFDTVVGVQSTSDDLRLDVCGVMLEVEEQEIDPSSLSYETMTSMSGVTAELKPTSLQNGESGMKLSWLGKEETFYRVMVSNDLTRWEFIPETYFVGNGETLEFVDEDSSLYTTRFYQLVEAVSD